MPSVLICIIAHIVVLLLKTGLACLEYAEAYSVLTRLWSRKTHRPILEAT